MAAAPLLPPQPLQSQHNLAIANPACISCSSTSFFSPDASLRRYQSPLTLQTLDAPIHHRPLVDHVNLSHDDDPSALSYYDNDTFALRESDVDVCTLHDGGGICDGAVHPCNDDGDVDNGAAYVCRYEGYGVTLALLDDRKNGVDILNVDNESVTALPGSRRRSHLYPHGQSSCHENRLLQTLCNEGHLNRAMGVLSYIDTCPSTDAYLSLLRLCHKTKSITHVKNVCAHLVQRRTELNGYLGDYLVTVLAKCGAVEDAWEIASRLVRRTVFSWTAIISAYVNRGQELQALKLYECMRKEGVEPDALTFVSLFKACTSIRDLALGKSIHKYACKKGLASENQVGNSLISMYGKCGAIFEAESAFMELSHRDVVSWTAMLSAYLGQGQPKKALRMFRQMQEEGMNPNCLTCVVALQACLNLAKTNEALEYKGRCVKVAALEIGQALHSYARRKDLVTDTFVSTTLLNVYGNCGRIRMAEDVFSMIVYKSTVSWNAMLSAYVDQSCDEKALLLFREMNMEGLMPDNVTYVSAVQACSVMAENEAAHVGDGIFQKDVALKIGYALHADVCINEFESDPFVATALLVMYGKCGSVEEAEVVFNDLSNPDLVSWTAMFSAYVEQGQGEKALRLHRDMQKQQFVIDDVALMLSWTAMVSGFITQGQTERALELHWQMQEEGVMLDDIALKCGLQACSLTGSLDSCREIHVNIVCRGYDVLHSVAVTLIDAYGNSASMVDAQATFDMLAEPEIVAWNACIAGHAGEGDFGACICMFEKLTWGKIAPDNTTFSSVLLVCCHTGLVARGLELFESMSKDFGVAPNLKHYGILIDLLGRAGDFMGIVKVLSSMPMEPDLRIWMCLLEACQNHGNVELANLAFQMVMNLHPKEGTALF